MGAALASLGRPRDQIIVATKVRGRTGPGPNEIGLSRKHIMESVDASLRRLRLDSIDLYQIHGVDLVTPIEETIARARRRCTQRQSALYRVLQFAGLAGDESNRVCRRTQPGAVRERPDVLLDRRPRHRTGGRADGPGPGPCHSALEPACRRFAFRQVRSGESRPRGARRTSFDFPPVDRERAKNVLKAMHAVKLATGIPISRIALAWLLTRPFVTSVIIGAKTQEQLIDNLAAGDVKLTPDRSPSLMRRARCRPSIPAGCLNGRTATGGPDRGKGRRRKSSLRSGFYFCSHPERT